MEAPLKIPTAAEKAAERRIVLSRIVENLKKTRRNRLAKQCIANWSEAELAKLIPFAEQIKSKAISYYRACMELQTQLPGRSFEAIRKKLKNWVNYGRWG